MKKGKIILGSAAFLLTVGSSLAFKVANKFSGKIVRVQLSNACLPCTALFFTGALKHNIHCNTAGGQQVTGSGVNQFTFFTAVKAGQPNVCTHPTTRTTIVNR